MSHQPVDIADDQREYGNPMGLGGMCFLELDLFRRTGNKGPRSLFCDIFNTPAVVAQLLDNDFQQLFNPDCYYKVSKQAKLWHKQYSNLDHMVTTTSLDLLRATNSDLFQRASRNVPAMFHHLTHAGGLQEQLPTPRRRADRTRRYLRRYPWKVLMWAAAVPYSYLKWFGERNSNADVLQVLLDVLVTELKELHTSLVRYECDNFVFIGLLIVHGAPPAKRFLRKAVDMSKEKRRGQRPTSSFLSRTCLERTSSMMIKLWCKRNATSSCRTLWGHT